MKTWKFVAVLAVSLLVIIGAVTIGSPPKPADAAGLRQPTATQVIELDSHANGQFHQERSAVYTRCGYIQGWNVYQWTPSGAVYYLYYVDAWGTPPC